MPAACAWIFLWSPVWIRTWQEKSIWEGRVRSSVVSELGKSWYSGGIWLPLISVAVPPSLQLLDVPQLPMVQVRILVLRMPVEGPSVVFSHHLTASSTSCQCKIFHCMRVRQNCWTIMVGWMRFCNFLWSQVFWKRSFWPSFFIKKARPASSIRYSPDSCKQQSTAYKNPSLSTMCDNMVSVTKAKNISPARYPLWNVPTSPRSVRRCSSNAALEERAELNR